MRSSGLIASPTAASLQPAPADSHGINQDGQPFTEAAEGEGKALTRAEEVAGMVWNFVGAAGTLATGLSQEDDVKLLRLRTKKNELVIVPG